MFKKSIVILMLLGWVSTSFAQLDPYKFRVGLGVGYTNYYGDLSPYRVEGVKNSLRHFDYNPYYIPEASYSVSLEGRISRSLSLMFSGGQYNMAMSDRYMNRDGILQTQLPNFNRSLNFQTKLQDAGIGIVFRTDNDRILNKTAFMAPYFTLGVGIFQFDVSGDLLDDAGLPYDYSNEMTIPNRQYETDLRSLNTELDGGYSNQGFYYGLGLGIRFKIAKQIELFVQSDFRHSSTDYLDDVSGVYRESYSSEFQYYAARPGTNEINPDNIQRGDPDMGNDWYIYHHAGLKISLAPSRKAFRASKISPGRTYAKSQAIAKLEEESKIREKDSIASVRSPTQPTNQYFNFFQINPPQRGNEKLSWRVSKTEESLELIADQREEEFFTRSIEGVYAEIDSVNLLASQLANTEEPTTQDKENINFLNQYRSNLSQKADSLIFRRRIINDRIQLRKNRLDSLDRIEFEEPIGYDDSFDTVLFNQNFREFYAQLNGALIQNDNWLQLSQTFNRLSPLEGGQTFDGQFPDQYDLEYAYPPSQRFYQDQRFQPQSYDYIPPDPWEQNIYIQPDPSDRISRLPRESRQSRTSTNYQSSQQKPEWFRQNQRSIALAPVFIPRIGVRSDDEPSSDIDSLQVQSSIIDINEEDSYPSNSLNLPIPMDSLWRTKVDTIFLDKKIIIGLPNSKKEVYFDINRDQLEESEKEKLEAVVTILEAQPAFYITLSGFADNTGDISYNLQLVERRVNHVKSLLVSQYNVDEDRISVKPGGLLIRNKNRASRTEDRKVEIIIYDSDAI